MDKPGLRTRLRAALTALPPLQRAQQEELVNAAVLSSPAWAKARTVLLFKHKPPELSVVSLTNAAFRQGKRVCFPRVEGEGLVLHQVLDWGDLEMGSFGIHEPGPHAPVVPPEEVDLAIVPGLGWTRQGDRLGQGGGFYDRLLPRIAGTTVGVGFDVQLLEVLPTEPHDVPVDRVVASILLTGE